MVVTDTHPPLAICPVKISSAPAFVLNFKMASNVARLQPKMTNSVFLPPSAAFYVQYFTTLNSNLGKNGQVATG